MPAPPEPCIPSTIAAGSETTVVQRGRLVVTRDSNAILATPLLGASVAVAIYARRPGVGGMFHFLLPDSDLDVLRRASNPELFADSGLDLLLHQIDRFVENPDELEAWIVGGADPLTATADSELLLGARNASAAQRLLAASGIRITAARVGGSLARRLTLAIATGTVCITETPPPRRGDAHDH